MKKQTAHKPHDQQVEPTTTSANISIQVTVPLSTEPVANGTKTKSNDGGYIWIV